MSLDKNPLLNENDEALSLTQVDFIRKFNDIGRIMISAPDLYGAGKSEDSEILKSLQKDLKESWIVTSTRIHYEDGLEGTITHYFGSDVISPHEKRVVIPYYDGKNLGDVLGDEQGLKYLQTLFNTDDNSDNIKKTLKKLSNKATSKTRIWTPDQGSRKSISDRAVRLCYSADGFLVNGYSLVDNSNGHSRGVLENPLGGAHENIAKEASKELKYPLDLTSGINRKSRCVYFSSVQNIGDLVKYAGLFCFNRNRFVVSLTTPETNEYDKKISALLSKENQSREILNSLDKEFSPLYAHLLRYEQGDDGFVLVDDLEAFGEPRIKELK